MIVDPNAHAVANNSSAQVEPPIVRHAWAVDISDPVQTARARQLVIVSRIATGIFDLDFLIVYALKLLILERWEKVNSADKAALLKEVLN